MAFKLATQTGIKDGSLEIVIQEDLWSIWGLFKEYEVSLSRMFSGNI